MNVPFPRTIRYFPICADCAWFLPSFIARQMILQFLSAIHVLAGLCANHFLGFRVLLPFESEHEQLQRRVICLVSLLIFAGIVLVDRLFNRIDGATEKVGVAHRGRVGRVECHSTPR